MRTSLLCLLVAVAGLSSGCNTASKIEKLNANLKAFELLGLKEVVVAGKVSHTQYKVTRAEGTRRATLDHSNPWTPRIYIERETPIEKTNE
jgi:hypothetical protein